MGTKNLHPSSFLSNAMHWKLNIEAFFLISAIPNTVVVKTRFTVEDENDHGSFCNNYSPLLAYPEEEEDTNDMDNGSMIDNNESKEYYYT